MRFKTNVKIFRGKIDLAPLVDVMFLLLVFFLISTSYDFQPGYTVDLPQSEAPLVRGDKLVVVMYPREVEGSEEDVVVFFNNEEVSWTELELKLAERIHDRTQPSNTSSGWLPIISLKADGDIPYRHVMRVNNLAYKLKVRVNHVVSRPSEVQ
jgi:biopolymer transport protein ExbD